jgi:hypothetical protein
MKRPRKSPAAPAAVAKPQIMNALPASSGVYRSSPRYTPWNSKAVERMMRSKDTVLISRFLQSEQGIPQVRYGIQQLPREAVGKGIGMKSVSLDADFRSAATALFNLWADSRAVDIRKERNFFQLQPTWLSAMLGDGECFILPVFEPAGQSWSLRDKSKRAFQFQTIARDQLTNGNVPDGTRDRWLDGLRYNQLDQLVTLRLNQEKSAGRMSAKYTDISAVNAMGHPNVFHLKDPARLNQYHGDPVIFASGNDLLDALDLKALRKHSLKVRAALMGATVTRDGQPLNAMQSVLTSEQTGTPAADTGRRFVELGEGAVFIPLSDNESFNFFTSSTEAVPFKQVLEDLIHPFVFELKYPPEWIFMRGKVGGVEYRGLLQQVSRAHEGMRSLLYPLLQWVWEKVIGTAMMPGGPLHRFAEIEDWNSIDFVTDPDPTVDAGRNHQADMDRWGENLLTADDFVERLYGTDGAATRHAAIDQRLDSVRYAIAQATGQTPEAVKIPASIATVIGLGLKTTTAASGLITALAPEQLAKDMLEMDA